MERVDRFRMPNDELPFAGNFEDFGRTIPRLLRRQSSPELSPGILIECNHSAVFSANEADQLIAIHEGRSRKSPERGGNVVLFVEVNGPDFVTRFGIEAEQVALSA